jgi:orotidine-5'-phosphate decarboxylase
MKRWMKLLRPAAAFTTVVLLAGCASMSEQECLTVDWHDQGYRDGRNGQPLSRVEAHREACAKVGVVPDLAEYRNGRATGILEYCTPGNAVQEGRRGASYRNACPPELEGRFLDHYRAGRRVYDAEQRVNSLDSRARDLQRRLEKEKDDDKRKRLRQELRDLDWSLRNARNDVYQAERRLRY